MSNSWLRGQAKRNALPNFHERCRFKKRLNGLLEVAAGPFDGFTLACDIEFGTKGDIHIVLPLNDGGELVNLLHPVISLSLVVPVQV